MQTKNFLETLRTNPGKELIFEYQANQTVPKAYHITEVKNVHIESVDCGGRPSEEFQTIVQLWVSGTEQADRHMLAEKAIKIFDIVDRMKPIRQDTPILFEWGDATLPTSIYAIRELAVEDNRLVVKMMVPPTVCKPKYELELAGQCSDGCC